MTVRASERAPSRGKWPVSGTRPNVGFKPYTPHHAAGRRMLPPESLPECERRCAGRDDGRRTRGRTSGCARRVTRVARRPVRRALGERGRDAGDDGARGAQARDRSGVATRAAVVMVARPTR